MTNWRPLCIAVLLSVVSMHTTAGENDPTLRLTSSDWAPYIDSRQRRQGVVIVLATTALRRAGYESALTFEPWPASLEKTSSGEYDVRVGLWQTHERAELFALSEPFLINRIKFMAKGDAPFRIDTKADLEGKRIGVVEDYAYSAKQYDTTGLTIVSGGSVQENLKLLLEDQLDLIIGDDLVMRHEADARTASRLVTTSLDDVQTRGLRIAVSRQRADHEEIVTAFNKEIATMKADGTYFDIVGSYGINQ